MKLYVACVRAIGWTAVLGTLIMATGASIGASSSNCESTSGERLCIVEVHP